MGLISWKYGVFVALMVIEGAEIGGVTKLGGIMAVEGVCTALRRCDRYWLLSGHRWRKMGQNKGVLRVVF